MCNQQRNFRPQLTAIQSWMINTIHLNDKSTLQSTDQQIKYSKRSAIFVCGVFFCQQVMLPPWQNPRLALFSNFLVYKDVWEHHYVFLLPILVALYARFDSKQLLWLYAALALPTLFVFFDVTPGIYGAIDPERSWSLGISLLYRSSKLVPTLVLWFWILRHLHFAHEGRCKI